MSNSEKFGLIFTGERFIPRQADPALALEHYHRYLFASKIVKGKRVLDIACGEGYGAAFLSMGAKGVVGVDNDPETIRQAKSKYGGLKNLSFEVGKCEEYFKTPNEFDVVVSFETLEHIDGEAQLAFLKGIKNSLGGAGILVISTPDKETYDRGRTEKNRFHKHELTTKELETFLHKYFVNVEISGQRLVNVSSLWPLAQWKSNEFRLEVRKELLDDAPNPEKFADPVYVVAICSDAKLPQIDTNEGRSFYFDTSEIERVPEILAWAHSLESELAAAKLNAEQVQKEFEGRTSWAIQLNEEIAKASEHIAALQKEFEERTLWAKSLDAELNSAREYTARLQKEFEERSSWALALSNQVEELKKRSEDLGARLTESERKAQELQVWGEMVERQHNSLTSSPFYKLLAFIGLLPKIKGS